MGLDSIELLVAVEKHFQISIPNKEAEKILTVDDFATCVSKHIHFNADAKCKSQCLFYYLRSYFRTTYDFSPQDFLPATDLGKIFPVNSRKERWEKLAEDFNIRLPDLERNYSHILFERWFSMFAKPQLQPEIESFTVRDLINWILSLNHKKLINLDHIFSKEEITRIIIGIIDESCGIDVKEIKPSHTIVDDLGIS